ncbi:hypothetical protein ACTTAL_05375 [Rhodobacter capsulatus]|uniref:hypothetical protein n=1 Tax=Rhodobacter capsulatus TaxID=1061 RepID=UPI0003D32EA2|nr:hypothetical protein [Rhodobacter capsulatus]ETD90629.1 hypothetical protein U713_05065 [Rhodobacter capsulatus YW2]
MTEGFTAYRARAAFVRGAARDHLRQLRMERIAAREAARAPQSGTESGTEPAPEPAEEAVLLPAPEIEAAGTPAPEPAVATAPEITVASATEIAAATAPETAVAAAPELPASEPAALPPPTQARPGVPLSPGMRRMLQARARAAETAETPAAEALMAEVPAADCVTAEPVATECPVAPERPALAALEGATGAEDPCCAAPEPPSEPEVGAAEDVALPEALMPDPEPAADAAALPSAAEPATEISGAPSEPHTPCASAAEGAAEDRRSDLARLPGAGPGLIWMLKECDIHRLEDLAAADCAELTARMGLAGRILDLGGWIAFARAADRH